MVLFLPLNLGRPLGFAPEAVLEDLGLSLEDRCGDGPLPGLQGFWQHQVLREVGSLGSRKYSALERYGNH